MEIVDQYLLEFYSFTFELHLTNKRHLVLRCQRK